MLTYRIDVSLPVFKALTARLQDGTTFDDVLRDLLCLDSIIEPEPHNPLERIEEVAGSFRSELLQASRSGFHSRNLWLPNGTELRARYKQRLHTAKIADNKWTDRTGAEFTSPSAAASSITKTNVNGLRFWEAKRPQDTSWRRLDSLLEQQQ